MATPSTISAGEWVEVRSKEEILRTLDSKGQLEGLPFMPEMFEACPTLETLRPDPPSSPVSLRATGRPEPAHLATLHDLMTGTVEIS